MLPQFGITEFLLLAVIALIVVGPKDLPRMMRSIGQFAGKARRMAGEFRASFDEIAKEAEMEELRDQFETLKRENAVSKAVEELKDVEGAINEAILNKPPGETANTDDSDDSAKTSPEKPAAQLDTSKKASREKNPKKHQTPKPNKTSAQTTTKQNPRRRSPKSKPSNTNVSLAREQISEKTKIAEPAEKKANTKAKNRTAKNLPTKPRRSSSRVKPRNPQRKSTARESVSRKPKRQSKVRNTSS